MFAGEARCITPTEALGYVVCQKTALDFLIDLVRHPLRLWLVDRGF